ncbi:unnamed protein product [Cyclocybe aegerita]|uniref:Uncharacterized protein n=1 Tax=Cyclocybe aegerita TaxID=1973307 RepID=A0A8S0WBD1_CYCAE|nr:unnamed protein product [Cyclocybe aegerita]
MEGRTYHTSTEFNSLVRRAYNEVRDQPSQNHRELGYFEASSLSITIKREVTDTDAGFEPHTDPSPQSRKSQPNPQPNPSQPLRPKKHPLQTIEQTVDDPTPNANANASRAEPKDAALIDSILLFILDYRRNALGWTWMCCGSGYGYGSSSGVGR